MDVTESILNSVKKHLGIDPSVDVFDPDVIIDINAALGVLNQLDVGPKEGFFINDDSATYFDFLGNKNTQINLVKQYLCIKTQLAFDISTMSSSLLAEMREQRKELEWRLQVQSDSDGGEFQNES